MLYVAPLTQAVLLRIEMGGRKDSARGGKEST